MAKKSFKENPALSFISQALAEHPSPAPAPVHSDEGTHTDKYTHNDTDTDIYKDADDDMYAHTHTEPSVLSSATSPAPPAPAETVRQVEGAALLKRGERKSRRLQLLIRPGTHEGISALARQYGTSVNDIINQILEDYLHRIPEKN